MPAQAYCSQELHGPFETVGLGDFHLKAGGRLGGARLPYATHGRLSTAKDNAILVTACSKTSKVMEQVYVGPGRTGDAARQRTPRGEHQPQPVPHRAGASRAGGQHPQGPIGCLESKTTEAA